jgi:hypothetical protein
MDILRLNSSTYEPDHLVEGLTSTIWTERLNGTGEFQLKTPLITETQSLLPEDSLITHLETREVMLVESHIIDKDDAGNAELTVKGRNFVTFAENRVMVASDYRASWTSLYAYNTPQVLALLLWSHLANTTGQDPKRAVGTISPAEAIPGAVVLNSTNVSDASVTRSFEAGNVWTAIEDILNQGNYGIRCVRPPTTGQIVSVSTSGSRGQVSRSPGGVTGLAFDVYDGVNRTKGATPNPVIFDYLSGHVDNPQYLLSRKDLKNVAVVTSSAGVFEITDGSSPSGLFRRAIYVDVGSKTDETTDPDYLALINKRGQSELAKHNRAVLFDGEISPIAPYTYGVHYSLGDYVTLSAEYGFEATMLVTEYVRTEDNSGDRGYPTLALPIS